MKGKRVLVTGGGSGAGADLALGFAKAGAQVVANFLLSPAAQARKADIDVWGDPTVLDVARLPALDRARFQSASRPGQVAVTAPVLSEPHASWVDALEKEWTRRYGV